MVSSLKISLPLLCLLLYVSGCKDSADKEIFIMPDLIYMRPTVNPGQSVEVKVVELNTDSNAVERFDLVVFRRIEFPSGTHVLRVLGLPGDVLGFTSSGITLNGSELSLPDELSHLKTGATNYFKKNGEAFFEVPEKKLFLIGDNMDKALDSRIFGSVDFSDIHGKVVDVLPE